MDKAAKAELPRGEFRTLQGRIKMAQKALGMDDDLYREMLFNHTGKRTTKEMTIVELKKILAFMNGTKANSRTDRPRNMKDPAVGKMLGKIEAMLLEAKREWAYAHGIAKKMFGVDRLEFCRAQQIYKIVQAMMMDAKRHGRRTE
jgi:phage gp16-like protein